MQPRKLWPSRADEQTANLPAGIRPVATTFRCCDGRCERVEEKMRASGASPEAPRSDGQA
jgi:hypothetical protein